MENNLHTLPQDLIFKHILTRLPAKSVGRFRCVCPDWRDTLSFQKFAKSQLKSIIKHESESIILGLLPPPTSYCILNVENETKIIIFKWFNQPFGNEEILLCGSFNGLVLVVHCGDADDEKRLNMFNLITRDTRSIPSIPNTQYELAYDEVCDDYKNLAITDEEWRNVYLSIFSLKAGSWRSLGQSPYQCVYSCCRTGCFINGALRYLACRARDGFDILAFNIDLEEFATVSYPKDLEAFKSYTWGCVPNLKVIRWCLAFLNPSQPLHDAYEVWVITEYGVRDCWVKYKIATQLSFFMYDFLGVLEDDNLIFKTSEGGAGKFASFNLKNLLQEIQVEYDGDQYGMSCMNGVQASDFRGGLISPYVVVR